MTVSQTTRFGLYRWSAATDEFTRDQMDTSHSQLESRAARFSTGASLPAHAAEYVQGFFLDTTAGILWYSNGSAWVSVNSFAAPSATITPGDTSSAGTATTISRSDHRHAMLPFASTTPNTVTTSGSAGSANTYARGDHQHSIANSAVTSSTIATGAINASAMIASNVITTTLIADANVTRAKIEVNERIPTGTILPFVGTTAPAGWALCDGATSVGAATELGILLGGASGRYGTVGGNPLVPDLRNRFPYGAFTGSWGAATGGAGTASLAAANLPTHTHDAGGLTTSTAADHAHGFGTIATGSASVEHTHSFPHTHTVSSTDVGNIAAVGANTSFGTVLGMASPGNTGGLQANIVVSGSNTGNLMQTSLYEYGNWTTDSQSTSQTTAASPSTGHTHTVSGSTANAGSHNHTLTGTTGNNASGSGTAFSIIPPYTGLNFIIKL